VIFKGEIQITQSEVSSNTGVGINLIDGELTLSRSTIRANKAGGITVANNKKFTIANNFIVGNTGNGGVDVGTPSAMSKFEFNTVVDNEDANSPGDAGGVTCSGKPDLQLANNIIFRNTGGPPNPGGREQTFGDCGFTMSYVAAGTGPTDDILKFDTAAGRTYHLTANSPVTVRDVPLAVCTGIDFDGDARPLPAGGTCDYGTDEYKAP
jgi:Right handed beta helix region